jgi:hypothetical protein
MNPRTLTTLAATLLAATALTTGLATTASALQPPPAHITATGYGPSLQAAELAAATKINDNYVCGSIQLNTYGQEPDGTWFAVESATCTQPR